MRCNIRIAIETEELLDLVLKWDLKNENLKHFVREEQARMCNEREKERSERQADKDPEFQLQLD